MRKLPPFLREALVWIFWTIIFQFVLLNISAAVYSYRGSRVYADGGDWGGDAQKNIFKKTWYLFTGPRFGKPVLETEPAFPYDSVTLHTSSGLPIACWYSKTDSVAKGTVILFHAAMSNKGTVLPEASEFRVEGYNVFLVDFRACGASGGTVTTMGYQEAEEVKLAFDYIQGKGEKNCVGWGRSMGAVALLRAVDKYGVKPAALILEKPYKSLQTFLRARARAYMFPRYAHSFFSNLCTFWTGVERGFGGFKLNAASYATAVQCPVLVQSGSKDTEVETGEVQTVFDALPEQKKQLLFYSEAGNESLLENDPVLWRRTVETFLK